jgi:hypothetical protein
VEKKDRLKTSAGKTAAEDKKHAARSGESAASAVRTFHQKDQSPLEHPFREKKRLELTCGHSYEISPPK